MMVVSSRVYRRDDDDDDGRIEERKEGKKKGSSDLGQVQSVAIVDVFPLFPDCCLDLFAVSTIPPRQEIKTPLSC